MVEYLTLGSEMTPMCKRTVKLTEVEGIRECR